MSDRFRFRAWDKFNDMMWYQKDSIGLFFTNMEELEKGGNGIELMQFTGLKDKSGTEIYEGDVAECDGRTVRWANGKFWFVAEASNQHEDISEMFGMYYNKVEVIGNIHQHAHLLE